MSLPRPSDIPILSTSATLPEVDPLRDANALPRSGGARRTLGAWRRTVKHRDDLLDVLGRSRSVLTADTRAALLVMSGAVGAPS